MERKRDAYAADQQAGAGDLLAIQLLRSSENNKTQRPPLSQQHGLPFQNSFRKLQFSYLETHWRLEAA